MLEAVIRNWMRRCMAGAFGAWRKHVHEQRALRRRQWRLLRAGLSAWQAALPVLARKAALKQRAAGVPPAPDIRLAYSRLHAAALSIASVAQGFCVAAAWKRHLHAGGRPCLSWSASIKTSGQLMLRGSKIGSSAHGRPGSVPSTVATLRKRNCSRPWPNT